MRTFVRKLAYKLNDFEVNNNELITSISEGMFEFSKDAIKKTSPQLNWWAGVGKHTLVFEKLALMAVSDTRPNIIVNDIITPKNAGNFEGADVFGDSFFKDGTVDITKADKYKGEKSALITQNSRLILQLDNLKANTEYSIFFYTRQSLKLNNNGEVIGSGKMEFRLSGFKDNTKYDYDNGNYNNSGGKVWKDKSNVMNWLENLKIENHQKWTFFRYDFTTGGKVSNSARAVFTAIDASSYVDDIYVA